MRREKTKKNPYDSRRPVSLSHRLKLTVMKVSLESFVNRFAVDIIY